MVVVAAEVAEVSDLAEHQEAMGKARGYPELVVLHVVEHGAHPFAWSHGQLSAAAEQARQRAGCGAAGPWLSLDAGCAMKPQVEAWLRQAHDDLAMARLKVETHSDLVSSGEDGELEGLSSP